MRKEKLIADACITMSCLSGGFLPHLHSVDPHTEGLAGAVGYFYQVLGPLLFVGVFAILLPQFDVQNARRTELTRQVLQKQAIYWRKNKKKRESCQELLACTKVSIERNPVANSIRRQSTESL